MLLLSAVDECYNWTGFVGATDTVDGNLGDGTVVNEALVGVRIWEAWDDTAPEGVADNGLCSGVTETASHTAIAGIDQAVGVEDTGAVAGRGPKVCCRILTRSGRTVQQQNN